MCTFPRLTSLLTLLIGLQVVSPTLAEAKIQPNFMRNLSANHLVVALENANSPSLNKMVPSIQAFMPLDNGGPDSTQGSGTR